MAPFPTFYDPQRVGTLFYPDLMAIGEAAAAADLAPAVTDEEVIHLMIIDMQVDFAHAQGTLHVPGSLPDIRRLIEFIYRNAARITNISCSLDSHLPYQIFHPSWWIDAGGQHPEPFTIISLEDVESGRWQPRVEPERSLRYVRLLEEQAKKQLTVWPYHVLIGSIGNALDPELFSAVLWHSLARKTQPTWLTKGSIPLTEHYSMIQPEIPAPGRPLGGKNEAFLKILDEADRIIIAGEAESHCVLETVEDLVEDFGTQPETLQKFYVLQDCTSPVVHPDVDFHAIALERFREFGAQGVNFINSGDPLPF